MLLLPPVHAKPLLRLPYFYSAQHFNTPYLYKSWLSPYRCQLYTRCSGPPSDVPTINGENSLRGLPAHPVSIVDHPNPEVGDDSLVPSARAIAEAIRRASHASPVQFVQRTEKDVKNVSSRPSHDFLRLCLEQMDLFRMIVDRDAIMSVYVRPAGSYVMDQIELHQIAFYPGVDHNEITSTVILIGNFGVPAGLRAAEAYLSNLQVISLPESGATVLPMVKHPFVVGFVVAELPVIETETCTDDEDTEPDSLFGSSSLEAYGLPRSEKRIWEIPNFKKELTKIYHQLTVEQSSRAIAIIRSLAMAYVMDQIHIYCEHIIIILLVARLFISNHFERGNLICRMYLRDVLGFWNMRCPVIIKMRWSPTKIDIRDPNKIVVLFFSMWGCFATWLAWWTSRQLLSSCRHYP